MSFISRHAPVASLLFCLLLATPLSAADSGAPAAAPAPVPAAAPTVAPAPTPAATSTATGSTTPGATPAPGAPLKPPPPSPFLGVTLDRPSTFDVHDGLLVTAVVPQSTFDHLGVRAGDHLLAANDTPLNAIADFSTIADRLQVGQLLTMSVRTDTAIRTVSGRIEAVSRPREISEHTLQLTNEIEQLRAAMGQKDHSSLAESLTVLKQLEADLPGMLDTFKQRYPKGKFSVSIHIDILSDQSADNPQPVPIPPAPNPPTPASPLSAPGLSAPSAAPVPSTSAHAPASVPAPATATPGTTVPPTPPAGR